MNQPKEPKKVSDEDLKGVAGGGKNYNSSKCNCIPSVNTRGGRGGGRDNQGGISQDTYEILQL